MATSDRRNQKPLCLLALDGGGIRGLSELIILEEIMKRLKSDMRLKEDPLPADFFDLIGGTSTGGLIALLLGRLRLSVPQARSAFVRISREVFSIRRYMKRGKFDETKLENEVRRILRDNLGEGREDERMLENVDDACKVFVCSLAEKNITARAGPHLFRTYHVRNSSTYNCKIWEASRATSAAPTYFKSILIGPPGEKQAFLDAGIGHNNPVKQVLKEARQIFPPERLLACIVSIGTGQSPVVRYEPRGLMEKTFHQQLVNALAKIATDTDQTAEEIQQWFTQDNLYFRFNVDRGLDDISLEEWNMLSDVRTHTEDYLNLTSVSSQINKVVAALWASRIHTIEDSSVALVHPSGTVPPAAPVPVSGPQRISMPSFSVTVGQLVVNSEPITGSGFTNEEIQLLKSDVTKLQLVLSTVNESAGQRSYAEASCRHGKPGNISETEPLLSKTAQVLKECDLALLDAAKRRSLHCTTMQQGPRLSNHSELRSLSLELRNLILTAAPQISATTCACNKQSVVVLQELTERFNQFHVTFQELSRQLAEFHRALEPLLHNSMVDNTNMAIVASERRSRQTTTTTMEIADAAKVATDTVTASSNGRMGNAGEPEQSVSRVSSTTVSTDSVSQLKLEFSRFQKRGCVPECECICHQRRRYRSPSFLNILGELLVGVTNLPLLSKRCTDGRCTQRSRFSATITYHPAFLLKKMVSLVLMTTSQGDPAACIKVRPITSDFSIYRAIEKNNVQAVRKLLDSRLAHPSASFKGGWTPLHYAISNGCATICRSLLARNADPLVEDGRNQLSPYEFAWTKILGGAYDDETQQEMEQMFNDRECLEEMRFTVLHRIIMGFRWSSLEDHLSKNMENINVVDSQGRTALSWAAQRGMVEAVETLLRHGADPNICSNGGHSCLMYAAEARDPGCLPLLLARQADVTQYDVEGQTALHYAAKTHGDLSYYQPLIEAQSNPNWATKPGLTPLTTVILSGHNEAVKYLVENGADVNLKGHEARSPALYAVEYNNHFALRYLHQKGADFKEASDAYPSIAHVAAYHADVESLQILANFKLTLRDVDCVDNEGLTIPQIVTRRLQMSDADESFIGAFEMFLSSVETEEKAAAPSPEHEEHAT